MLNRNGSAANEPSAYRQSAATRREICTPVAEAGIPSSESRPARGRAPEKHGLGLDMTSASADGESMALGYKQSAIGVVPEEWDVAQLSDILDFRNGANADKVSYGRGIRFINVLEVITHSHLTASDIPGRVSLPEPLICAYEVQRGDLVFN